MLKFGHVFGVLALLAGVAAFADEVCVDDSVTQIPVPSNLKLKYAIRYEQERSDSTLLYKKYHCWAEKDLADPHHPIEVTALTLEIGSIERSVKKTKGKKPTTETIKLTINGNNAVKRIICEREISDPKKRTTIEEFSEAVKDRFTFEFQPVSYVDCHRTIKASIDSETGKTKDVEPGSAKAKADPASKLDETLIEAK